MIDDQLRKIWSDSVAHPNFYPSNWSYLCSKHFDENDLVMHPSGRVCLRKGAFPKLHLNVETVHSSSYPSTSSTPTGMVTNQSTNEGSSTQNISCNVTPKPEFFKLLDDFESAIGNIDDHDEKIFDLNDTPRKISLKRKLSMKEKVLNNTKKKLKYMRIKNSRLSKKVISLSSIISELESKLLISKEVGSLLHSASTGVKELFKRNLNKDSKKRVARKYNPDIRAFAMTLHFYSPQAYSYVRKSFSACLPHPRTLSKWYQSVSGDPGFCNDALETLKQYVNKSGKRIPCCLVMDEMAIRQHVEWFNGSFFGYVDFGAGLTDDSAPIAKEALVFMIVPLNAS